VAAVLVTKHTPRGAEGPVKIDVYNHILPKPYFDKMSSMSDKGAYMMKRVTEIPMLYDVEARFEKINQFGEDKQKIYEGNARRLLKLDI
jgi:hypothetical protein